MDIPPTPEEISLQRYRELKIQRVQNERARQQGGYIMLHVPLPFQLPLHESFTYRWNNDDARQLEIVHYPDDNWNPRVGEPIFELTDVETNGVPQGINRSYTVVRIGMPIPLNETNQSDDSMVQGAISDAGSSFSPIASAPMSNEQLEHLLDEGLNALNYLIRSLRVVTGDPFIYPIEGLNRLPLMLLCTFWDIREAWGLIFGKYPYTRKGIEEVDRSLFLLHVQSPYDREFIQDQQVLAHVVGLASAAQLGAPHPFFTSADLMRNAELRMNSGDHNGTVTESITVVEVFVGTVVRLHREHQGRTRKQVSNVLQAPLKNVLQDHLSRIIGVNFDSGNPSNPIDRWYASSYRLRGDVVHQGEIADTEQARSALAEAKEFIAYVREQMKNHQSDFSHILKFLSDPP